MKLLMNTLDGYQNEEGRENMDYLQNEMVKKIITPNMPFFAVSSGKNATVPRWLRMSWEIDFSIFSPISDTSLPSFMSSIRINLARSSTVDGMACSKNSF